MCCFHMGNAQKALDPPPTVKREIAHLDVQKTILASHCTRPPHRGVFMICRTIISRTSNGPL